MRREFANPSIRLAGLLRAAGCVLVALGIAAIGVAVFHQSEYRNLNDAIAPPGTPPEERVLRTFELVSRWRYFDSSRIDSPVASALARFEHAAPVHLTAWSVLHGGVDHIGPCGGTSRAMIVLLRNAGIRARKAILYESPSEPRHTVVEVWLDGEWRVFDPTYAYYWRRDADGEIATATDLAQEPNLLSRILEARPDYPVDVYHYREVHHLRWEKVPGLTWVRSVLRRTLGDEPVRAIGTPYAYDRPYATGGACFLIAGIGCCVATRRRSQKSALPLAVGC